MSKVYVTGDIHGSFARFTSQKFRNLTKEDIVIVLGDFGGIWAQKPTKSEKYWLDWLDTQKPFTVAFIDGNHENFDRLESEFPIIDFYGAKAHKINSSVYHILRGEILTIEDYNIFCFGGAASHDIDDGIVDIKDYANRTEMIHDFATRMERGEMLRINHESWWEREMPSREEMDNGLGNLERVNGEIDYVISHSLPANALPSIGIPYGSDPLTNYFQDEITPILKKNKNIIRWYSGHYHLEDTTLYDDNITYIIKYHGIERII